MRMKDLFHGLLLVPFLILAGCGAGGNTDPGGSTVTLTSISVTPANPSLPAGVTKQFAASGIFSDGTSRDITTQATWKSSNTSVVTVNSSGLATTVATGNVTITAGLWIISGNTPLTVTTAGIIRLAWKPLTTYADGSPLTDLAGYKIYYGTAPGTYGQLIDVGSVTTYTLVGLAQGQTYYIAATAYDTYNNESDFSNEVSGVAR